MSHAQFYRKHMKGRIFISHAGANAATARMIADYLSSAGLRVIEALAADRSARGGRVTLRAPSIPVRLALELAGHLNLVTEPPNTEPGNSL